MVYRKMTVEWQPELLNRSIMRVGQKIIIKASLKKLFNKHLGINAGNWRQKCVLVGRIKF